MAKIDITKTELVWPGKYNDDGSLRETPRVQLPFQVIETVNESRATREAQAAGTQPGLFDVYEGNEGDTFEDGWRNKLIWGDNLLVMGSLLEKFAGKIDLIYIDPPFATGADFSVSIPIGERPRQEATKGPSILEEHAYRDTWRSGIESYSQMIADRLTLARELLSPTGSIYVHCDWRVNSHIRLILDDLLGAANFQREIIWDISVLSGYKTRSANWIRGHDTILYYSRTPERVFNRQRMAHRKEYLERFDKTDTDGRAYFDGRGPRRYLDEVVAKGKAVGDVWYDIMSFQQAPTTIERVEIGYATQKPEALLDRIIRASSNEGGLVADLFCGSGTTLAVAEKLARRWIGCDLGRWAIHLTRKRLLGIKGCQPFDLLNLGKYERQYWQGATFAAGDSNAPMSEQALYEYLAFVLRLYGARPVPGSAYLHGKKGAAMIHIGAVDAPVTIADVHQALEECACLHQNELHVLGWEWEMGMAGGNDLQVGGLMQHEARSLDIDLKMLQIPRELMEQQAVEQGDIRFFELAFLEAEIEAGRGRTRRVVLRDFVISNSDLIPEDVRDKVTKWSDWIDYWAVDWDFRRDTFMQGWVTYRTRQDRTLALESDPHTYEEPGRYTVLIKVVDIFGNDTSQALPVEVG